MKQSELFLSTMRDMPSDAETASHRLLLRGGYMRQVAAGVYSYLPLGWKVLRNLQELIREEMERAGAQEMLMPAMQPADLWRQSERYEVYGEELMRLCDRHEREFVLGPTHEEVVTALVRDEVNSYKRLPLTLYQIQTKYRDERRPRHGLLRCREFIMKDAYSFHLDADSLQAQYDRMVDAYHRVMQHLNLTYCAVEADAGA
ncbi:proline--tRNA ligase, partial [Paenibacillus sp. E194]|uniref:proline--tRNA ligase n=1 Tax=Paenibacillus sp. E194 TaxID=1458845 RepID=UPI0005C9EDC7